MASYTPGACKGSRREVLTPFVEILVPRVGRLMPFLCALKFWLWLVWFLDLAISVEEEKKPRGSTWKRGETPASIPKRDHRMHQPAAPFSTIHLI